MRKPASFGLGLVLATLAFSLPAAIMAGDASAYQPGVANVAATGKPIGNETDSFHFAIVGDRTGGHRPGVFRDAIRKIDTLRPDFVLSVGDMIEGKTEDRARINREWDEIEEAVGGLRARFFHVPGNHDLANNVQREIWNQRFGADYYSFAYKNVLFLVLNTEDPPQPEIDRARLVEEYGPEAMQKVISTIQSKPEEAEALFASNPKLAELADRLYASEDVAISNDQLKMVQDALARHPAPRWTFVLMHRPAWKIKSPAFQQIEAMLADRPHTILAGHFHKYSYEHRSGTDYIQLGTTGGMPGGSLSDPSVVDHIMWVAMDKDGPHFTNLKLNGFFPKTGPATSNAATPATMKAETK